jgi:hypothetical protein
MDHWFDNLSKQFAKKPSRRTFVGALTTTLVALASDSGRSSAFAAAPVERAIPVPRGVRNAPRTTAKTLNLGPCTATSNGLAFDHQFRSEVRASGRTAVLQTTRSLTPSGITLDKAFLIDGKAQFKATSAFSKSSQSTRLTIGNAFGYNGAVITSNDGGRTLHGEIGGRAFVPWTKGSRKKIQFVDGKALNGKASPGVADALKALAKRAQSDIKLCGSRAHAGLPSTENLALEPYRARHTHDRQKTGGGAYTEYWEEGGVWVSSVNTDAYLSADCISCGNNCDVSLATAAGDALECALGILDLSFDGCSEFVGLTGQQEQCLEKCNAFDGCFNQLCLNTPPQSSAAPIPTCDKGDICLKNGPGYCCPRSHPNVCPGSFDLNLPSYQNGINWGTPGSDFNNFCCAVNSGCLFDPNPPLYNYGIFLCCPKDRICGKRHSNPAAHGFSASSYWEGTCCAPGLVCTENALPSQPKTPTCCPPRAVHNGKCCNGGSDAQVASRWCGDECCEGPCDGDKCAVLCLQGVACGKTCCTNGCADAKTSRCHPSPKCARNKSVCLSTFPNSSATKEICCAKGGSCYDGKCCPKNTTACANGSGTWGCWKPADCRVLPQPK